MEHDLSKVSGLKGILRCQVCCDIIPRFPLGHNQLFADSSWLGLSLALRQQYRVVLAQQLVHIT